MLVTIEEADAYFATRLGASTYWASGTEKEAALTTAENQLAAAYGAIADKPSIYEQALFLLMDAGIDARSGLRAQGVSAAGIVQESYRDQASAVSICPYARSVLGAPGGGLWEVDMEIDEDQE